MTTGQQLAIDGQDTTLAAAVAGHIRHLDVVREHFEALIYYTRKYPSVLVREYLGRSGFTAEDVRTNLPPETCAWLDLHPNLLPAMFGAASRTNRIRAIGWTKPTRPSRHGSVIRIWKGTRHA
jgi:hypothetical protein